MEIQKSNEDNRMIEYTDTRFLLPTSIICELISLKAGRALNDRRIGLTPGIWSLKIFPREQGRMGRCRYQ